MQKIWIDALSFEHKGGFIPDTQFVREMGQGYLLANGAGEPVEPANTVFSVDKNGKYRILIRTKNWNNEYNPDGIIVSVDGIKSEHVCAEMHSQGWYWEIAGDFDLSAGTHKIEVSDTKGWFGRFSAVMITNDFDFTPSPEIEKMRRQRWEMLGDVPKTEHLGNFDFAVVGGGAAGVVAAVAASRHGLRVAFVNDRPVLGGNGSDEAHISLDGAAHKGDHETGIIYEIKTIKECEQLTWSEAFAKVITAEKNISLYENMLVDDAVSDGGRIKSLHIVNTYSLKEFTLSAEYYCDATGDAWLGYYADAIYHVGREAKHQYNEAFAPEIADGNTMSGCITKVVTDGGDTICSFWAQDVGYNVPFDPPDWAYKLPEGEKLGRRPMYIDRGEWWLETPNDYDDIWESEYVRDTMFRIAAGYFDWLKNSWKDRERVASYALRNLGTYNAKRESRRLIGDYIMTQNDFSGNADFHDAVCYTGWNIDVHHVKGIFSGSEGSFALNEKVPVTPVPFRCLYSKNIKNLFMVGRCASVSHIGLGAARTQLTGATMGQAVGTAAYLCNKYRTEPKMIGSKHIEELQQLLMKDGQYIPGVFHNDPDDIAKTAQITADSETENGKAINIINGKTRPRDGFDYAWVSSDPLPQSIFLKFGKKEIIHEVRITFDIPFDRYKMGYMTQPERDEMVTDFIVEFKSGDGYKAIAKITDNYQRLVCIDCKGIAADEIKITVTKCHKADFATITEVRVY